MKYRKKPVEIDAVQYTVASMGDLLALLKGCSWIAVPEGISILTPEGNMLARPGDYIVKGVKGEFYPVKPDIFEETNERASGPVVVTERERFIARVEAELDRAYAKHGRAPWSRHEFYAVLLEEVDELWDDIKADAPLEQMDKELVQVAAMCLRYFETRVTAPMVVSTFSDALVDLDQLRIHPTPGGLR